MRNSQDINALMLLPLLTPAIVVQRGARALPKVKSEWCRSWFHQVGRPGEPWEDVTTWTVGKDGKVVTMTMTPLESALLLELTRFEGSIVTNRNTPRKEKPTTFYPKFLYPGAATDNLTVHRVLGNAGIGEEVGRASITSDLRGAARRKTPSRSAKKDAWATAYGHCKRYAEKAAEEAEANGEPLPFAVAEYLANLEALHRAVLAQSGAEKAA